MKKRSTLIHGILCILFLNVLILGRNAAMEGCRAGIQLCIHTVIPSIFPFCILSGYMVQVIHAIPSAAWAFLGRMVHMPHHELSVFTVGLLGGYPLGAQCIQESYAVGYIDKSTANRMLMFCNNSGPAFILGFGSQLLPELELCIWIWGIHIISAYLVGTLSSRRYELPAIKTKSNRIEPVMLVQKGTMTMGIICAWIILFRTFLGVFQKHFGHSIPHFLQIILSGIMELSNGCSQLQQIETTGMRVMLFSVFIAFGGICVLMQTGSVAKDLSLKGYLYGKIAQVCITVLLCLPLQFLVQDDARYFPHWGIEVCAVLYLLIYFYKFRIIGSRNFQTTDV